MKDCLDITKSSLSVQDYHSKKIRQYKKLTQIVKKQLIELIVRHNYTIRKASRQLNINYSSAKIILNKYRTKQRTNFVTENQSNKIADFRETCYKSGFTSPIILVSLIGGRYQSQNSQIKSLIEPSFIL